MATLGIVGQGPFGQKYAETLCRMEIDYWQAGRDWMFHVSAKTDGIIVASAAESHFEIASFAIRKGFPVVIEKPVCLCSEDVRKLEKMCKEHSIVFTGHTRLFSPAWREFNKGLGEIHSVCMVSGGASKLGWEWDWCPHLVAMCLDLGYDPLQATMVEMPTRTPITVVVNNEHRFVDGPTNPMPLEVLVTEFCEAIKKGEGDIEGLKLGRKVIETIEAMENVAA